MCSSLERLVDTDIDKYPSRKDVAKKHIRNEICSALDCLRMDAKHGSGRHSFEVAAPEKIENRGEYLPDGSPPRCVQVGTAGGSAHPRRKANEVSFREMSAIRTILHEELHEYSPDLGVGGYLKAGVMIEEATTEVLARKLLRERFGFEHPTLNVSSDGVYGNDIRRMRGSLIGAMKCTAEEAAGVLERTSIRLKQTPKVSWHPDRVLIVDPEYQARLFVRSVVPPDRLIAAVSESSRPAWVARMRETLYDILLNSATRRDHIMNRTDALDDELDVLFLERNQPEVALELLKKRHEHKLLRDEDIKIALKLQDDRATLSSAIRAAGLKPNDPTDDW